MPEVSRPRPCRALDSMQDVSPGGPGGSSKIDKDQLNEQHMFLDQAKHQNLGQLKKMHAASKDVGVDLVNVMPNDRRSALMLAVEWGDEDMVRFLVHAKADVNARRKGCSVLDMARYNVVPLLSLPEPPEPTEAEIHAFLDLPKYFKYEEATKKICENYKLVNANVAQRRFSALMFAVEFDKPGAKDLVKYLLHKGADREFKSNDGRTAKDVCDPNLRHLLFTLQARDTGSIANKLNDQLMHFTPGEVGNLIDTFIAQTGKSSQTVRRHVWDVAEHGSLEGLGRVHSRIKATDKAVYIPGFGSLADIMVYLSSKKTFGHSNLEFTNKPESAMVIVVDDVMEWRRKTDPALSKVWAQCTKIHVDFDMSVICGSLDVVCKRVKAKIVQSKPESAEVATNDTLTEMFNGRSKISKADLDEVFGKIPVKYHSHVQDMLWQTASVSSMRTFGQHIEEIDSKIKEIAGGHPVFYYIPSKGQVLPKSYCVIAAMHRVLTGKGFGQYIQGPSHLASRVASFVCNKARVFMIDDVAASGDSQVEAAEEVRNAGFQGKIISVTVLGTEQAEKRVSRYNKERQAAGKEGEVHFWARVKCSTLDTSPWFRGLEPADRTLLHEVIGNKGWSQNALNMAFPYMAPDNNNAFFADQIAKHFLPNKNGEASKVMGYYLFPKDK